MKPLLAHADSAAELRAHLEAGKKLITTTIQKFPFIVDGIADMSDKMFAVILDGAHSSQGGQAADKLNMSLGGDGEEEPEDYQDKILQAMERRKLGNNASYFAFTATPKKATLEKFGIRNADGGFDPFHLYSMKQAIKEDFILDVISNYDSLNGFHSKDIPEKFSGDIKPGETNYRRLVVANKFLTGFDEPLLHTMYEDKRLQGVLAVQALSRLNRCNAKMQKQDTFILDFYNTAAEIKDAFDPFYAATSLSEPTDINVLHDLKDALDDAELYSGEDIEKFNQLFFNGADGEQLHPIIDETASRFDLIENETDKIDFKIKAKQFVKLYGQLACILPFSNAAWEKLHWFLKFLIPKLKVKEPGDDPLKELLESVDLSTYGLERVRLSQHIGLYKVYAGDPDFKRAFDESIIRILALHELQKTA